MSMSVFLVGLGAAVGGMVGMIPALVAAKLLGYLPAPQVERRMSAVLAEPPTFAFAPEAAPAAAPESLVLAEPAEESLSDPPRSGQLTVLAHARHQAVYDAAYAEQLDRVERLRSVIGGRRGKSSEAPGD